MFRQWIRWRGGSLLTCLLVLAACRPGPDGTTGAPNMPTADGSTGSALARLTGETTLEGRSDSTGAQVYIPGTHWNAFTDGQGRWSMEGLRPGAYEVFARADGYVTTRIGQLTIEPSPQPREYALAPSNLKKSPPAADAVTTATLGSVQGLVSIEGFETSELGNLEWNRCIIELAGTPYRTTCMPDGSFLLWNVPADNYLLRVNMSGYASVETPLRVLPGPEVTPLEITLQPAPQPNNRTVKGQVELYDAKGNPTNDFDRIAVQAMGRPDLSATLSPDGAFELTGLAPGRYVLTAIGEGYAAAEPIQVDLSAKMQETVTLRLFAAAAPTQAPGSVRGLALKDDPDQTDMSGITVGLIGSSSVAMTDPEGRYLLQNVMPGIYRIRAQAEGFESAEAGPIEVTSGTMIEAPTLRLEPKRDWPRVLETDPADGARNVLIRREIPITIRFSKKMSPDSLRRAIRIEPSVAFDVYAGRDLPDTDFDLIVVQMHGAVNEPVAQFRTRYRLTIDRTARDFDGLTLEKPFEMSFTTGDPAVIGTVPDNGGLQSILTPTQPVVIFFNAKMDPQSLGGDTLRIRPGVGAAPNLSTYEDPVTGWTQLNIGNFWQPGTTYEITVQRRARTAGKNPLSNTPYSFRFKTTKLTTAGPFGSPGGVPMQPVSPTGR